MSRFLKKNVGSKLLGEVTQESEIRELVQKTARDLVVVTADKPGRRPAICELLRKFLAPRISVVTPHENHALCFGQHSILRGVSFKASEETIFGIIRGTAKPTGEVS